MNDALVRFFNKIKFNYSDSFKNTIVSKVVVNKQKESWVVYLKSKNIININDMNSLFNALNISLPDVAKIDIIMEYEELSNDDILKYINYYLEEKISDNPSLSSIRGEELKIDNDVLNIEVISAIEQELLLSFNKELPKWLNKYGLPTIKINACINEEKRDAIKKEIEEGKVDIIVNKEPEFKVLMGQDFKFKKITNIKDIIGEEDNVVVEAYIFGVEEFVSNKSNFMILTLKISDKTDSILLKIFTRDEEEFNKYKSVLKENNWYRFRGYVKNDQFAKDLVFNVRDIVEIPSKDSIFVDDAEVKRVELHAHTMMSQLDGITKFDLDKHTSELVSNAIKFGYRAVAITDHGGCQAFPICYEIIKNYNKGKPIEEHFKGIFGTEISIVDDDVGISVRPQNQSLKDSCYVVFDTETTGFNAGGKDQMIEIGAVKLLNGEIIDRFDEFINPGRPLPQKIVDLTCITDDDLKDADTEDNVTRRFLEWTGDNPMIAHNAKFDISFIEMAMKKYNLGEFKNTVIDTLELSRALDPDITRHNLSALVKRYDVPWNEDAHHRADYDAEGTAYVYNKMLERINSNSYQTINDLDKLISKENIYKLGASYHINILVKNKTGLKNLFKIVSLANTTYYYKSPRIPRSVLNELREGLLIGSGCFDSEIFREARRKDKEELTNLINFYDYVEVQPIDVYHHLIDKGEVSSEAEITMNIKKIVEAVKDAGKIMVATCDVHHFYQEDRIYRQILVGAKVNAGKHHLARSSIKEIPSQHFRTTNEMLSNFSFLGDDVAYEIVVENTNKIADMIEEYEVIPDTGGTPFSPRVKADDGASYLDCPRVVTDLVYDKAISWYGDPLPLLIEERIAKELYGDAVYKVCRENLLKTMSEDDKDFKKEVFKNVHNVIISGIDAVKALVRDNIKEHLEEEITDEELEKKLKASLGGVIGAGFDPIYLIAQRLVKHSNDEGFLVGSRGSVGSSFVATMMGITEVNSLAAHYRCLKCKTSIFTDEEGNPLGAKYSCGIDLPGKMCPNCNVPLFKDGHDIPFETFLGFNADKVPDIDLNFSDLNQASAHEYTKVLFGVDNVYRAGTIGTIADKTAFGIVKSYNEERGVTMRVAEIERLARGITGVKRTTGQHPGGIVVVPDYMDVADFTPFQYPAEDVTSAWRTTHFGYHSIEECLLKLDILGHSDPTQLRIIQEQAQMDVSKIPLDDKDTMSIFSKTDALGVTNEQIHALTGTLGIPEFGTNFTIGMVDEIKPKTFAELVKIAGLSHGTDVWLGNAQELIKNNIVPFSEVIGCRDDIMVYLMYHGVEPIKAFKIMEFVRKGKASKPKEKDTWEMHKKTMMDANIPDWFIDSCFKIKYMFPKAHAAAYVVSAFRIAWIKVHKPVYFYSSWLSCKATDFDVEVICGGYESIKAKVEEIINKGYEATAKELGLLECLKVCLEASARGIKFAKIDLYKSDAKVWQVKDETTIYPSFLSIDGLGETVAKNIVEEREKGKFVSVEDFQNRCKVSTTVTDKMRSLNILSSMPESSQLSLFDF